MELNEIKLKLKYVNFVSTENKDEKYITLKDVADKLTQEKRLMLGWYDDILPDIYSKDENDNEIIIKNEQNKFIIHLYYQQTTLLNLEYINDNLTKEDFYTIRKKYFDYIIKQ